MAHLTSLIKQVCERWIAIRGRGARWERGAEHTALHLSTGCETLEKALVVVGEYRTWPFPALVDSLRPQVYSLTSEHNHMGLCLVAMGCVDLAIDWPASWSECFAAAMVVEEAGGCVCTWKGEPLQVGVNAGIIASNCRSLLQQAVEEAQRSTGQAELQVAEALDSGTDPTMDHAMGEKPVPAEGGAGGE